MSQEAPRHADPRSNKLDSHFRLTPEDTLIAMHISKGGRFIVNAEFGEPDERQSSSFYFEVNEGKVAVAALKEAVALEEITERGFELVEGVEPIELTPGKYVAVEPEQESRDRTDASHGVNIFLGSKMLALIPDHGQVLTVAATEGLFNDPRQQGLAA